MTQVTGNLIHILNEPSQVAEVRVAVQEDRPAGTGIALDDTPNATYDRQTGVVAFDAIPGPAILLLKWVGETTSKQFSMLIPESGPATLRQCVEAAMLADEHTITELERLALEVTGMVATVGNITQLETWADSAKQDATTATAAAGTAQEIATSLPATIQSELDTRVPPEVAEALSTDQTIRDAATLAVNDAVDAGLPGKADTSYVDQQDQALGQRLDGKASRNDENLPQIKLSESLAWAVTDGTNSAISVDIEGTTKIGRIDSATSRHIATQVGPELGVARNLVMADDSTPFRVSDGEYTALAVTSDGAVDFRRLTPEALAVVAGAGPEPAPSTDPAPGGWVPETTSGLLRATYLPTGESVVLAPESADVIMVGSYPTWEQDGQRWWQEVPHEGPWKVAERHRLAAWGSSSVRTYHDELTARLPEHGITDFLPGGIGSDRSAHILGRMGARPFVLATDLAVPESGPVQVEWLDMPTTAATASFTGTLGGIHGAASTAGRVFSFTRTDPGSPVTIPAGTEFLPDSLPYRDALVLLNVAKNDINGGYMNADECLEQNIIASEWLRSLSRRYLVLGHFRNRSWADDDPKHAEIIELNRLLAEHYGDWYVDQQDYLMGEQVWDDTGLTPTAEDLDYQAKGVLAPSLGPDGVHTGSVTSAAVVNHIIIPAFVQKGWIA